MESELYRAYLRGWLGQLNVSSSLPLLPVSTIVAQERDLTIDGIYKACKDRLYEPRRG